MELVYETYAVANATKSQKCRLSPKGTTQYGNLQTYIKGAMQPTYTHINSHPRV